MSSLDEFIKSCTKKFWDNKYEPLGFEMFHRYCDDSYPQVKFYIKPFVFVGEPSKDQVMTTFNAVMVKDCSIPNTDNVLEVTLEWVDTTKYEEFLTPWKNLYLGRDLIPIQK